MASLNYLREMLTMLSEEIRVQQTSLTSSSTWEASTWSSSKSVGSKVIVGLKGIFVVEENLWLKSKVIQCENESLLSAAECWFIWNFYTNFYSWQNTCCYDTIFVKNSKLTNRLLHSVAERVLLFLYDQPVSSKRFSPGRNTSRSFISCKIIPPVP